jgi:2-(1,2-epoxy-1,2-dihydrophenyl)acetyl-CoA isomerase
MRCSRWSLRLQSSEKTAPVAPRDVVVVRVAAPGVRELRLHDPTGRNPVNVLMRAALRAALLAARDDPQTRAILISSAARNFSVGGDVDAIAALEAGTAALERMTEVGELAALIGNFPKPLVAAVNGHCVGAGAGLALLCDTIVAGAGTSFSFPFLRLGLVPDFGVSRTLALRVGSAAARQVLLYGRAVPAADALRIGLVDQVVDDPQLPAVAVALAEQLAAQPPDALRLTRQLLRDAPAVMEVALRNEASMQALRFGSVEVREGVAAFREKRAPDFVRARGVLDDAV